MFVLPGCEDTNERNTQVRRRWGPLRCYQRRRFPTFVNEELSRVEAGPDGRRRVGDVSLQKLKGILLWMPLRPVNGVTVGCREFD